MKNSVVWFKDEASTELSRVGGKGANLGRLTQAGFTVPPGFVVDTDTYRRFIGKNEGLKSAIAQIINETTYDDADKLEISASKIRALITAAEMPNELARPIQQAYEQLGNEVYVAVRSSGTAEDLEGTSFAGLHDTYLDIKGAANVLDAVKRCWASLWSTRAMSYRQTRGFDHFHVAIAIVVQQMVESDIAGVMFTGNPINTATDQILINASWGLGEAIVSGMVTPDEYIVRHKDLKLLDSTLGTKEKRVVRNRKTGNGTIVEAVPEKQRSEYTLSKDKLDKLATVGLAIQESYEGFPQDIEWGYKGDQIYILQARPITAVQFSWDADVTSSVGGNDDESWNTIWSRTFPEEMWTGAITPLMFSWRTLGLNQGPSVGWRAAGFPELDYHVRRLWIYNKGVAYYNCETDRQEILLTVPPHGRKGLLNKLPVAWHEQVLNAPFDWGRYLKWFAKVDIENVELGIHWWQHIKLLYDSPEAISKFNGLSYEELKHLTDKDLKEHIFSMVTMEIRTYDIDYIGLLHYFREAMGWLAWMVDNWYTGGRENVAIDLLSGQREPTATSAENFELWEIADRIYRSSKLKNLWDLYPDETFFEYLSEGDSEYVDFRNHYQTFVKKHGHRGHSDRDIYFTRRADDPSVDTRVFRSLMGTPDPRIAEERSRKKLEEVIKHVYENFKGQPLGVFKAEAFSALIDLTHKYIAWRDLQREMIDRSTYAIKRGYSEVARRIDEKQPEFFTSSRDFYFLTQKELFDVLDGKSKLKLAQAKIASRKKNFDIIDRKEAHPSHYLLHFLPAEIDAPVLHGDGVFNGKPVSIGNVTGTARVIHHLKDIGRVKQGEILVVHSTDPGWTPVFTLIRGIVLETGGTVSHGALLAREYGFPGVQLAGATRLIPDGATITVNGNSGVVLIVKEDEPAESKRAVEA